MHIYAYIRVSGRGQVEGDGPERQREAILALCAAQGLSCAGEFFERGVSGTIEGTDRPAFSDMLERIPHLKRNGIIIGAIVVERADRLARDLLVSEMLLSECRKRAIQVFAADRGLVDIATNEGDPTHKLIRQVIAAVAEFEKSTLVRKLRRARDRVKARTGHCDGAKKYGHYEGENLVLAHIRMLASAEPRPTFRDMAISLNQFGLRTRRGGNWTRSLVHRQFVKLFPPK